MIKRGGPVVLHKKVRNPRQRVRNHKRQRNPPPALQRDCGHQQRPSCQRPCQVNRARASLAVGPHIFGPERCEVCLGVHNSEFAQTKKLVQPELRTSNRKLDRYSVRMASMSLPRTRISMPSGGRKSDPCAIAPPTMAPVPGRVVVFAGSNTVCVHGLTTIGCFAAAKPYSVRSRARSVMYSSLQLP